MKFEATNFEKPKIKIKFLLKHRRIPIWPDYVTKEDNLMKKKKNIIEPGGKNL